MIRPRLPQLSRPAIAAAALVTMAAALGSHASAAQIEFGGPEGSEEKARVEIYDALRAEPRETPVSLVAQAVGPSVVYVETEMVKQVRNVFGRVGSMRTGGSGSGVVIHPSGLIITNYHVVEGARNIRVSFEGNPESYPAQLMSAVREEDLALLKIVVQRGGDGSREAGAPRPSALQPAADQDTAGGSLSGAAEGEMTFPTVRLGTSADLMPGERVVAIGSPHGQTYTVSTGIISGLHREVSVPNKGLNFQGLIQTDASINFGNSGGPLLNIHGELIGINTVMNTSAENIGFAIPVDRVRQVLEDELFPNARQTWLGFEVEEDAQGLVVSKVWPMGPADGSGICEGDRITALRNVEVPTVEAFNLQSLHVGSGERVGVQFARGSESFRTEVEGWDELNGSFFRDIGMTVDEVRAGRQQPFLRVVSVLPGSAAAQVGIEPNDLLQAVKPRVARRVYPIALSDKATLKTLLDRVPVGTEIEIDAYRDMDGNGRYSNDEFLKGVMVR